MKKHAVIFGNSQEMRELQNQSIQLIVTSPPYFDVKDYGHPKDNIGAISSYDDYLAAVRKVFTECYRVLEDGRYCCVNVSDIISDKHKYPIPAHYVSTLEEIGFTYRDDIIWKKPDGVGANSGGGAAKRFGVFIQNPYPMYYYPNNVYEHILIFRKGKFDFKKLSMKKTDQARIDVADAKEYLNCDVWEFTPQHNNCSDHPAMFPAILPETLIKLFTYREETVLDPFLGSGTTTRAARKLGRNSVGYEINQDYLGIIKSKVGYSEDPDSFEIIIRGDEI